MQFRNDRIDREEMPVKVFNDEIAFLNILRQHLPCDTGT